MRFHFGKARRRRPRGRAVVQSRAEGFEPRVLFSVFTVTSTADGGPGSLRQAILDANAAAGADEIHFDIAGAGVHTIAPLSALPALVGDVTLDATTQPGYAGSPLVELNGSAAGATADGLVLRATSTSFTFSSLIRGVAVNRFGGNGVVLDGSRPRLEASYVGLNPAGDTARPNGGAGVLVHASDTVIGGTTPAQRNVISGNAGAGVQLQPVVNVAIPSATIQGNYIGTDATGSVSIGNGQEGILVAGARTPSIYAYQVTIGGTAPGAGNVISGNGASGVRLQWSQSNTISGNYIGTDATGRRALPNGQSPTATYRDGITAVELNNSLIVGGSTVSARNVISANLGAGLRLADSRVATLQGNYIGCDATGEGALGNDLEGVYLVKERVLRPNGTVTFIGNVISGNGGDGVHAEPLIGVLATNNYIGLDAAGTAAMGNAGDGLDLTDSFAKIGEDRGRNVISANGGHGIRLTGTLTGYSIQTVSVNYIGTDATGTVPLGNKGSGVYIEHQAATVGGIRDFDGSFRYGNVISGNGGDGVTVLATASSFLNIRGNLIGTSAAGGGPGLGNAGNGVSIIDSSGVKVGGPSAGDSPYGNRIAFNGGDGVRVTAVSPTPPAAPEGNRIQGNAIYSNGGISIDLAGDGVAPNDAGDADSGPNRLVNYPMIVAAPAAPASTLPVRSFVRFTLAAEPLKNYDLSFYSAPSTDRNGHGQAVTSLGFVRVTTDAAGNAAGAVSLAPVAAGQFVSATATDSAGNTSEFSAAVAAVPPEVTGRFLFYNDSVYDGHDAAANRSDDAAIAADKYPSGGPGATSLTNVSSYTRGINGVIIDLAKLPAGASLTPDDFTFSSGAGDSAAGWASGPVPSSISVRRGEGVGGSDRVTLVWPDTGPNAAVRNGWLQITVKANANTGLSNPDVFYFGNLVGEIDSFPDPFSDVWRVDNNDLRNVRQMLGSRSSFLLSFYDFNRDGVVNVRDLAAARANYGASLPDLTVAPAQTPAALVLAPALAPSRRGVGPRRVVYQLA